MHLQRLPLCQRAVQPRKAKKDQKVSKDGLKGIMSLLFESERLTRRDRVMRLQRASEDIYMSSKQLIRILKKIKDQEERREIMDALMPRLTDPENKLSDRSSDAQGSFVPLRIQQLATFRQTFSHFCVRILNFWFIFLHSWSKIHQF